MGVRGGTVQTLKSFPCQVNKCEFYLGFGAKKKKRKNFSEYSDQQDHVYNLEGTPKWTVGKVTWKARKISEEM